MKYLKTYLLHKSPSDYKLFEKIQLGVNTKMRPEKFLSIQDSCLPLLDRGLNILLQKTSSESEFEVKYFLNITNSTLKFRNDNPGNRVEAYSDKVKFTISDIPNLIDEFGFVISTLRDIGFVGVNIFGYKVYDKLDLNSYDNLYQYIDNCIRPDQYISLFIDFSV